MGPPETGKSQTICSSQFALYHPTGYLYKDYHSDHPSPYARCWGGEVLVKKIVSLLNSMDQLKHWFPITLLSHIYEAPPFCSLETSPLSMMTQSAYLPFITFKRKKFQNQIKTVIKELAMNRNHSMIDQRLSQHRKAEWRMKTLILLETNLKFLHEGMVLILFRNTHCTYIAQEIHAPMKLLNWSEGHTDFATGSDHSSWHSYLLRSTLMNFISHFNLESRPAIGSGKKNIQLKTASNNQKLAGLFCLAVSWGIQNFLNLAWRTLNISRNVIQKIIRETCKTWMLL